MHASERVINHDRYESGDNNSPEPIGKKKRPFDVPGIGQLLLAAQITALAKQISEVPVDRDTSLDTKELDCEAFVRRAPFQRDDQK